jgi:hypothetical protein
VSEKAPIPTEHDEQCVVIEWWDRGVARRGLPIHALFAIPNAGAGASRGQAGKMKAEGARSGVPDLFLAAPRGRWHGLFIEMKRRDGGRVSFPQQVVMDSFGKDYRCVVAKGADEAMQAIRQYLSLDKPAL